MRRAALGAAKCSEQRSRRTNGSTLDLSRKLARPSVLSRGRRSRIDRLHDAAILIRLRQPRPVWDRVAEMILIAAGTGDPRGRGLGTRIGRKVA